MKFKYSPLLLGILFPIITLNAEVSLTPPNAVAGECYAKVVVPAKYKTLEVYDKSRKRDFHFEEIVEFWSDAKTNKSKLHRLLFYMFISLIPILSVYLVAAFTMINPRYQENRSFLVIFFTTLFFYVIASILQKWGNFYLFAGAVLFSSIVGRVLFHKRVARYF
jgi:lipopolysaccharide export system permease protein